MADRFEEDAEVFSTLLQVIIKRIKVIILVFIITLIFAFSSLSRVKPLYSSSAEVMIGPDTLQIKSQRGEVVRAIYSYGSELALIKSDIIAGRAAAILKEEYGYNEPIGPLKGQVKGAIRVAPPKGGKDIEKWFRYRPNIIVFSAITDGPKRSLDIVNTVIEAYRRQKKEDEENFYKNMHKSLAEQLDTANRELYASENALTDFIRKNKDIAEAIKSYNINEKNKQGRKADSGTGINDKYLELKSDILAKKSFINAVEDLAKRDRLAALTTIGKGHGYLVDMELKRSLLAKEEELNSLLLVNEEVHPEVIRARGEVKSIENKIDAEVESAIKSMRADLDILKKQEQELSLLIDSDLNKKMITYNMLKRDTSTKQNTFNKITEKLQDISLGEGLKRYSELRILKPARAAGAPFNKSLPKTIMMSIMLAIFSCAASTYLLETLDTSVKDVEQLENLVDLPVLVTIPTYNKTIKEARKKGA